MIHADPHRPYYWGRRIAIALACVAAVVVLSLGGCTDEDAARDALHAEGFTQVRITGYEAFSCSKDDGTCTGFEAVGPSGAHVAGAVGCGWFFKGCTVRISGGRP